MLDTTQPNTFPVINRAYNSVFQKGRLSIGLVAPLEAYPNSAVPTMQDQVERIKLAEQLGFAAIWLRDVPFNVPVLVTRGRSLIPGSISGIWQVRRNRSLLGWRARTLYAGRDEQPVMQPLYVDLVENRQTPQAIHLGLRLNARDLVSYLKALEGIGLNHVALNMRFNQADTERTLKHLAEHVLPEFT